MHFWLRHIEGRQIGALSPYTSFGGTRYVWMNNGVLLASGQGLITNNGQGGGNGGLQRRWLHGSHVVGLGSWFDIGQSRLKNTYQQFSLSGELLGEVWSLRGNVYLPFGTQRRDVAQLSFFRPMQGVTFQGNNLISLDTLFFESDETSMRGFDVEVTHSVFAYEAEVFAGYCNFQGRVGRQTHGIKGGARGYLTSSLHASVVVSNDTLFGTSVFGGFTWFFGGKGGQLPADLSGKLTIPVQRNEQVVVNRVVSSSDLGAVILTQGGVPITVTHVNGDGTGPGVGTFEDPLETIANASGAAADIVYAHSGTEFSSDGAGFIGAEIRVLGEGGGVNHVVVTDQLGAINLPAVHGIGGARPLVHSPTSGIGFDVAGNVEVSNFDINDAPTAIRVSPGIGNLANFSRLQITNGGTGFNFAGARGTAAITGTTITNPTTTAINIAGGDIDVTFGGSDNGVDSFGGSTINQGVNASVINVASSHAGSFTMHSSSTITATNGNGLQFDDADGTYAFNGTTTLSGGDAGIDIVNGSDGTFAFRGSTPITNATGTAVYIDGRVLGQIAAVIFLDLDIRQSVGAGVFARNSGDLTINFSRIANTTGDGVYVTSNKVTNLTMHDTMINTSGTGTRGIIFQSIGGDIDLNHVGIDMNNATSSIGIRLENLSRTIPMSLSGSANMVMDAPIPTISVDAGGGFNGTIGVNGGTDDLPGDIQMLAQVGDIFIIGVDTQGAAGPGLTGEDGFAFVTLADLSAGEVFYFSDGERDTATSAWGQTNSADGAMTFTVPASGLSAGHVVRVVGTNGSSQSRFTSETGNGPAGEPGTLTLSLVEGASISDFAPANSDVFVNMANDSDFNLNSGGDTLVVYQGSTAVPTFISAIYTKADNWVGYGSGSNSADVPEGLTDGVNSLAVGYGPNHGDEANLARYEGPLTGAREDLLTELTDIGNWQRTGPNPPSHPTEPHITFDDGTQDVTNGAGTGAGVFTVLP